MHVQAVNYVGYFANFSNKPTAYFGTSENTCAIGGLNNLPAILI